MNASRSVSLNWDDVEIDERIGTGSFASVFSVVRNDEVTLPLQVDDSASKKDVPNVYALKCIDGYDNNDPLLSEHVETAVSCLVQEAAILRDLPSHPNIIKLYGVSEDITHEPVKAFLLFERVATTLDEQIPEWKRTRRAKTWNMFHQRSSQRNRIKTVAVDLVQAMKFLHENQVLYRDLKPGNVGIRLDRRVCLFDFGLARKVPIGDENKLLTKAVGTPRYMAQEVWKGFYGLPADVYAFSLILWELLTLEKPFEIHDEKLFKKTVYEECQRPSLRKVASKAIRRMLSTAWDPESGKRPTFAQIDTCLANFA